MKALSPEEAIGRLAAGDLVGFPTETSWGLAADVRSDAAMSALFDFKGRDAGKYVSVLLADAQELVALGAEVGVAASQLVSAFWPGPLTLVLSCLAGSTAGVAGAGGSVGFRCSPHPVARELARLARSRGVGPLTATSLNASGEPACATRAEAEALAAGRVALVAGEDAGGTASSTVVDATGPLPRILREGAIPRAVLARSLSGELAA